MLDFRDQIKRLTKKNKVSYNSYRKYINKSKKQKCRVLKDEPVCTPRQQEAMCLTETLQLRRSHPKSPPIYVIAD